MNDLRVGRITELKKNTPLTYRQFKKLAEPPPQCDKHPKIYLTCPYCAIETKDALIEKLVRLVEDLTEENKRLLECGNNQT